MGPSEKIFKKEYAAELLKIAENDLVAAKTLSTSKEVRKETTLFNVEQAVEKALKAVLCHWEKPVPLTHDLYAIIQKFETRTLPPGGYALHDLTPFASIRRYEEGKYVIDETDVANALNIATQVIEWSKLELKK